MMFACGANTSRSNSSLFQSLEVDSLPNPKLTPGDLCTSSDPNFIEYRYPEQIAYCQRNVSSSEKLMVGKSYGIDPADFPNYEFDHYIPLAIGGSDDLKNLWPQPLSEAQQKDALELALFKKMSAGTITQFDAVAAIKAWRPN